MCIRDRSSTVWIYNWGLSANWLQDSISNAETPTGLATSAPGLPPLFNNLVVSLTQVYVDEASPALDDYGLSLIHI